MVALERKKITAIAADDDRAPSFNCAFEHAIVGRATSNGVDRLFRHDDLGNAENGRRQDLDFMVRERELVRPQYSLEFVHQNGRYYPFKPPGQSGVDDFEREPSKEKPRHRDVGVDNGADQARFRASETAASTSAGLMPFLFSRFEAGFLFPSHSPHV